MNPELETIRALRELLRTREEENARLAQELEDTNRGVLALYAELDDRASLLRNANELKDQFISHLSHEFRTPLNSITALSAMLLEDAKGLQDEEQRRQAGYIRKSALELLGMVNDLLDLAKIEAGEMPLRVDDVSIADVFSSLRGLLRPLVANGVELVFEDASDIAPIRADEAKLTSILRNLVSNALKFTEAGEVRVSASVKDESVQFAVRDTGIGIPASERERVFEAFTQVDNPLQRKATGTGLGLSLSRALAAAMGGSLRVESDLGRGSTFYLVVPLMPPVDSSSPRG